MGADEEFANVLFDTIEPQRRNDMAFGQLVAFEAIEKVLLEGDWSGAQTAEAFVEAFQVRLIDAALIARCIYDESVIL